MSAKNGLQVLGHNAAANIEAIASELASEVGAATSAAIDTVTKAKEDWEGGPFVVMFALQQEFDLSKFPDPTVLTGEFPAKYETKVQKKTKIVDFYAMFFDKTSTGARYVQELEWIKRLRNKDDGRQGIDATFIADHGQNEMTRAKREDWIKRRRNIAINSYRKAVQLAYQLEKASEIEGIKVVPLYTDATQTAIENTPRPIQIYVPGKDGAPPTKWDTYSVASFLRMDIEKALESETPFEALEESLKRDKTKDGTANASDAKPQKIATTDTAHARLADVLEYFDEVIHDPSKAKLGTVRKAMRPGEGDGFFMTAYGVMEALKDIIGTDADAVRYEALRQKMEKAAA